MLDKITVTAGVIVVVAGGLLISIEWMGQDRAQKFETYLRQFDIQGLNIPGSLIAMFYPTPKSIVHGAGSIILIPVFLALSAAGVLPFWWLWHSATISFEVVRDIDPYFLHMLPYPLTLGYLTWHMSKSHALHEAAPVAESVDSDQAVALRRHMNTDRIVILALMAWGALVHPGLMLIGFLPVLCMGIAMLVFRAAFAGTVIVSRWLRDAFELEAVSSTAGIVLIVGGTIVSVIGIWVQ